MALSTPPRSNASLDTFTLFPRLPLELQRYIWASATTSRTLRIRKYFSHDEDTQYLYSPDPVPAVLQVCRESRLNCPYLPAFGVNDNPRYTWVNFDIDTIHMPDYALYLLNPEERAKIRWVVLEVDNIYEFSRYESHDLSEMCCLEELTLLSVSDIRSWLDDAYEVMLYGLDCAGWAGRGRPRPSMRIIEITTGEVLRYGNGPEILARVRNPRDSELGWGFGPDVGSVEAEKRIERRALETAQRGDLGRDSNDM